MAEKQFQQPPPYSGAPTNVYPNLNQQQNFSQPGQYPGYTPQGQPTIIINKAKFGPFPVRTECQICKAEVVTLTQSSAGLLAYLLGGACLLFGCWFGCCLIPCCVDSCRDVVHRCPNCQSEIALFKRL